MAKSDRVSLRADDALLALSELRLGIERTDGSLAQFADDKEWCESIAPHREERWQAYQRIAKALGLPPTLSTSITPSPAATPQR